MFGISIFDILKVIAVILILSFLIKKFPVIKIVALWFKDRFIELIAWIKSLIKKK